MVFKSLPVVNWRSEDCDVTFRCLSGGGYLEASVLERSLGMLAEGNVGCSATCGLVDVLLGSLGVLARW
jgi:hypothetical protein